MSRASDCIEKISSKGYKNRDGSPVLTPEDFQRVSSAADPVVEVMKMMDGGTRYSDATPARQQVFGVENAGAVKPERSMAKTQANVRQNYFNGSTPVTPDTTAQAFDLAYQWSDELTGQQVVADLMVMNGGDALVVGVAQGELMTYAVAMSKAGDNSLLNFMNATVNTWAAFADAAAGTSEAAVILAGRSAYPMSAFMDAVTRVGKNRTKAVEKTLPKETAQAVTQTVAATKLEPKAVRKVKGNVKDKAGETLEEKVEKNVADVTAQSLLERFATSQSDTLSWMPKGQENKIRALVRRALTIGPKGMMWDKAWLTESLIALEVTPELAAQLTETVWAERKRLTGIRQARAAEQAALAEQKALEAKDRRVAAERERQLKANEVTANAIINQLAETQSDTPTDRPKPDPNAVRVLVKQIMDPNVALDESAIPALVDQLVTLNVDQKTAEKLAGIAWEQRKRNIANLVAIDQQKAQAAAEALIDQIPRTPAERNQTTTNADKVRAMVKQVMDPNVAMDASVVQPNLVESIVKLNVNRTTAEELARIAFEQRQKNVDAALGRYVQRQEAKAQALAEGTAGSLRGLEDALLAAPASQQQNVKWRYDTAEKYFEQLGLSPQRAAAAARAYNVEFGARLADALANAIERVAATSAPWQKKLKTMSQGQRKKALTGMEKLLRAVRVGVTDPDTHWYNVVARQNGWRGFTNEQNVRLHEIDDALASESIADYQKKALMAELQTIVDKAKIPPSIWDNIVASYTLSALSGLPTVFVQISAYLSILRDFISDVPFNPTVAARTLIAATESLAQEGVYALKTDVHNHQVSEHIRDSVPAMKMMLEEGLAQWHSPNLTTRAMGFLKIVVGGQQYLGRLLNSIDEGSIAASEIYKTSLFTTRQLKTLGWTRNQAGGLVLASLDARNGEVAAALQRGLSRAEATVSANEIFRKRIHEGLSLESKEVADDVLLGAARESMGMVGRRSEGVGQKDEGFARVLVNYMLEAIGKMHSKGGGVALVARLLTGFVTIPFNAAMWYSGYSPYGFIRLGIHGVYKARGLESPYQQSMGTRAQEQQRMRDAIVGSVAMALGVLLRSNSGDDDPDEAALFKFIVTGKGPTDTAVKQAWNKRFQPYSLNFKFGKTYIHFNLGRAGESLAWPLALAGALDDVALNKKGKRARNPGATFRDVPELFGSYWASLSQRGSFQSIGKIFGTSDRGQNATIGDKLIEQAVFSAAAFAPWKGAMASVTRMASDPVDNKTMSGVIWSNTPIVGPMLGRPALNNLGDPLGDRSAAGRLYWEGVPMIVRFPASADSRVYDLIIDQGRGPSAPSRADLEQQYGPLTPEQFYNFSKERGRLIKEEMNTRYEDLRKMDSEKFGNAMERIGRNAKRKAAQSVALKKVSAQSTGNP